MTLHLITCKAFVGRIRGGGERSAAGVRGNAASVGNGARARQGMLEHAATATIRCTLTSAGGYVLGGRLSTLHGLGKTAAAAATGAKRKPSQPEGTDIESFSYEYM